MSLLLIYMTIVYSVSFYLSFQLSIYLSACVCACSTGFWGTPALLKVNLMGGTWAHMKRGGGMGQTIRTIPSQSRGEVMAQVKVAGDAAARSHQDCAEVYSDMATVSSSAGESKDII